jgi:hypothetical protein
VAASGGKVTQAEKRDVIAIVGAVVGLYIAFYLIAANVTSTGDGDGAPGGAPSLASSLGSTILGALASFESVASQHNNPGGICGSYDSNGQCLGPATFDTLEEGSAKAIALINKYLVVNPSITVAEFVQKWSGGSGLVLQNYINKVSGILGLDPNEPIADVGGDEDDVSD